MEVLAVSASPGVYMEEIELLRRRLERERSARKAAESFAETKTRELFEANQALQRLATTLQEQVDARTAALRSTAEEALAASRMKSIFLSNVSHELRTPLNAIIGYGELLCDELTEKRADDLAEQAARIVTAAQHLHALVNDLLDLQKVEADKLMVCPSDIDIPSLVGQVCDAVAPTMRRQNNALVVEMEPGLRTFRSDELRLRQILVNLMSNAAKFTRDGRVTLRVHVSAGGGRDSLIVEVEDTGVGMTPDQITRLFAPFAQVNEALARRHHGTGLGLALTRRLCRLLGGEVTVVSEPGRGSCFRASVCAAATTGDPH